MEKPTISKKPFKKKGFLRRAIFCEDLRDICRTLKSRFCNFKNLPKNPTGDYLSFVRLWGGTPDNLGFLMGIFIIRLIIFVFCTILICPLVSYYVDLFLGFIVAIPALLGVFMTLWHLDILKRKEYCPFGEFIRRPFRKFLNGK